MTKVYHSGDIRNLLSPLNLDVVTNGRFLNFILSLPSNSFTLLLFLPNPLITSSNNANPGTVLQFATRLESMVLIYLVNILYGERVLEKWLLLLVVHTNDGYKVKLLLKGLITALAL